MKKNAELRKNKNVLHSFIKPLFVSLIAGLVIFLLFTGVCAAICVSQDLSFDKMPYMLMCSCVISAAVSGAILSRRLQMKGIFAGMLAGTSLMLIEIIVIFSVSRGISDTNSWLIVPLMLVSGACGGIAAANFKRKRK